MEVWKTKFQEQVEATAAAAAAAAGGDGAAGGGGGGDDLDRALEEAAQAREEAERWKEKAVAAQELEGVAFWTFFVVSVLVFGGGGSAGACLSGFR